MIINNWILRFEAATVALVLAGEIGGAIFAGMIAAVLHIVKRYK